MRVSGLHPALSALADAILPVLRESKRALIALGALAVAPGREGELRDHAEGLAAQCRDWADRLVRSHDSAVAAPLAGVLADLVERLGGWASSIGLGGMSPEAADGLAVAYRNLRAACDPLWLCELAPEGNLGLPMEVRGG